MKINYRPEIDGLRAIAVIAVIFYHAQINIFGYQPFKGGFIGVDIFFVISGYLISSIILKELNLTGNFSFKFFYERRIRRILPVLIFIMLVSFPFAWRYFLPGGFIDYSKSLIYSLGFSSNFYFYFDGLQYGAADGISKPFLHTWSLSVEEQYYIIFPFFLFIIFKFFKKYLLKILFLAFIFSLFSAEWGSKNFPSSNFYFIHARIFELISGSILAYFEINLGYKNKNKLLNEGLSFLGIVLVLFSIILFDDNMYHPSFYTLIPVIGICLVIWFAKKDEIIKKILSSKVFVGVGLISYSLYLWHYPIFAFARITEITPKGTILGKIIFGILIVSLSILTYFFIEKPARNKNYNFKIIFRILLTFIVIIIITNLSVIFNNGFEKRLPIFLVKNLKINSLKITETKINNYDKKVFLVGDSHMKQLHEDLKNKLASKNFDLNTYTVGGCLYYPEFNKIILNNNKIHIDCNNEYFLKLKNIFDKNKNSIIIFGGRMPLHLTNELFDNKEGGIEQNGEDWGERFIATGKYKTIQESFKNSLTELSKNNKLILIYPIPEVGWNVPRKIYIEYFVNKKEILPKNYITTSYKIYMDRNNSSFKLLNSIQGNDIYRVYPHQLFCDTVIINRCITHDSNNIFYSDDDHPSITGAEMINNLIIKEIEKIMLR